MKDKGEVTVTERQALQLAIRAMQQQRKMYQGGAMRWSKGSGGSAADFRAWVKDQEYLKAIQMLEQMARRPEQLRLFLIKE